MSFIGADFAAIDIIGSPIVPMSDNTLNHSEPHVLFCLLIFIAVLCDTGHYGGGMGDDSSSSGGELEAGELVIDDSYTHLSKKKKKSKKSKKKKDKEKDRDKDKSGKDKKHSKGFGGNICYITNML